MGSPPDPVFVTGGTGYIGRPLIDALLAKRYSVSALVRSGSEGKLPAGARPVIGDALDEATFVHLVGTPHPNPSKAAEFQRVDRVSIGAAVAAARSAGVRHFVYVSVAHPAPIMQAYIAVRQEGEALVTASGIRATILRPWYVLGPGHRWPLLLVPAYAVLRRIPATRETAERLGLVTRDAMIAALVRAVETPPMGGVRILDVPDIRRATSGH